MQYRQSYRPPQRPAPRRLPLDARLLLVGAAGLVVLVLLVAGAWRLIGGNDDISLTLPASEGQTSEGQSNPGSSNVGAPVETITDPAALATAPSTEVAPISLGIPVPEVSASAVIVVDDATLAVLYDKDGFTRRAPASLTKIATAIVTVERARLHEEAVSPVHYWELEDSSTMALEPGDVFTLRELLYGLMLVSGNDAAITIAEHVAGTEEAFVAEMNQLVARLGLTDTHFENTEGLSAPGHYSSAWDLAILSRYLMRFPDLRQIVGTEEHTAVGTRGGEPLALELYNHNPLLNYTPGVDGVKTGYTEEAGRTFVFTAERNGNRVYIVLLDTVLRAHDSQALIEWAFENHQWPGDASATSSTSTNSPEASATVP